MANFGINGNEGRDSVIYFCNIQESKVGKSGVKSFPTEKYFYDIEGIGEHKQIIEKCFSKIEGEFSSLLREVLNLIVIDANDRKTTFVQLSSKQKDAFSAQLAVQKTSTRAFRDYYKGIYRHLKENFPLVDIPLYDETDFQRLHISEILCSKMSNFYANLFDDRHWVFLINYTEMPFLISDNSVIIIDNRKVKSEILSPVSDKATFYFPISPTVAVEIYDKNVRKNDLGYFDIYLAEIVEWYNIKIRENCTRFLFLNKDFNVAKNKTVSLEHTR